MDIHNIIGAIENQQIRISDHAKDEAREDALRMGEVYYSVRHGEIIEDYPEDKPYPSCLIYGKTENNQPVHSVWAYNKEKGKAVVITVYRPDPARWTDWRERKAK